MIQVDNVNEERTMPFVEVKSIRGVFSPEEKAKIIEETTAVFGRMKGDAFAAGTWVVVNELDDGNWGEGGEVLRKEAVPADD
jgi:4-oxalocrotonate tautomerase